MTTELPYYDDPGNPYPARHLGFGMLQNRLAVPLWGYFLEEQKPTRVIELGTYEGGLSILLAIACRNLGIHFVTFDRSEYNEKLKDWFGFLHIDFRKGDIFSDQLQPIIDLVKSPGTTLLLCDGGNKPMEFSTFAAHLKPGDVIAAHDYTTDYLHWPKSEITRNDVEPTCLRYGLEPFWQEYFTGAAWLVRRKK